MEQETSGLAGLQGVSKKKPSEVEGRESLQHGRGLAKGTGVWGTEWRPQQTGEARPKAHISCFTGQEAACSWGGVCLWGSPLPRGMSDHVHSHFSDGKTEAARWGAWLGKGHRASGGSVGMGADQVTPGLVGGLPGTHRRSMQTPFTLRRVPVNEATSADISRRRGLCEQKGCQSRLRELPAAA